MFLFFKQKTAYEMRISDWSSDVCSSDLAVAYYDKGPIQARVAWNWRDKFLAGTGPNPFYVEAYWQTDASPRWEFVPGITGFVEGVHLTGDGRDRERVVSGKGVSIRVDLGCRRITKKHN